jgi:hypothetical protein
MGKAELLSLGYEGQFYRILGFNVPFDLIAKVSHNHDCFVDARLDQLVHNMGDDRLAGDIEQYFWL